MSSANEAFTYKKVPLQVLAVVPTLTENALQKRRAADPNQCVVCNKAIDDEKITIENRSWHCNCLVCELCNKKIISSTYQILNGSPLHTYCYNLLKGPYCFACGQILVGKDVISVQDKLYHAECLRCSCCQRHINKYEKVEMYKGIPLCFSCFSEKCQLCPKCHSVVTKTKYKFLFEGQVIYLHDVCCKCTICGKDLNQDNFAFEQGQPLCKTCWFDLANFICIRCKQPILPNERISYGGIYHMKCFTCHNCHESQVNSNPEIIGDTVICQRCFCEFKDRCSVCFEKIKQDRVEQHNRSFHSKCFVCCKCKANLHTIDSVFKGGKLYCANCASN